jgi:heat shock protein HslJ
MMVVSLLVGILLLGACTFTVQPENATGGASSATPAPAAEEPANEEANNEEANNEEANNEEANNEEANNEATAVAEFVLPNGTSCLYSGIGATVSFDGKVATYSCTPIDATENATQTLAILDEPIVVGPTEFFVDFATIANTGAGFELHESEVIEFTAWEVVLEDGRVCLHAGFGATMGFDDKRLNYTCDKGESTADEVGLMGELVNQGEGVWVAQIDEIGQEQSGFVQLSSTQVPVARVSGVEVTPGEENADVDELVDMRDELIGIDWQWVQTEYGDGSVEVAVDPSRYTLLFDDTGFVAVTFDCNGGGGPYTVEGSSLAFGPLVSTKMACPAGSQDAIFAKDLGEVYSYAIEDGHLFLSMKLDTGIIEFAPAE